MKFQVFVRHVKTSVYAMVAHVVALIIMVQKNLLFAPLVGKITYDKSHNKSNNGQT